jgi:transposase
VLSDLTAEELSALLSEQPLVVEAAQLRFAHIRFLDQQIAVVEQAVEDRVCVCEEYQRLLTVPGIGRILALTIQLETGPVERFAGPGHYASYCRCVKAQHTSNTTVKREGNRKCGNRYLAWAYLEAAHFAASRQPQLRAWYQRKAAKTKRVIALKALANKLAKACYFILRDGVAFDVHKLVG